MKPALVVLAAGAGERLGACKALVDLHGRSPLERLLGAARGTCEGALVVSGAHHAELCAAAPTHAEVLHNPDWAAGRGTSLRAAAARLPGRDLCIAPVDVPLVPARVFRALTREWEVRGAPALGWLGPRLDLPSHRLHGRFGHPIVLGSALAGHLAAWGADRPLRDLRSRSRPLMALDVADLEVMDDLDTPQDLAELRKRLKGAPPT